MQQDTTVFAAELEEQAHSLGTEFYGVASAAAYAECFPDKPSPESFVEGAQSIVVIGLPFEPGTIATVFKPELAALRDKNPFACSSYGCCATCLAICPVGSE